MDPSQNRGNTLDELRDRIDEADRRIIEAVEDRMDISAEIAQFKKAHGMPVLDARREREKLADIVMHCREDLQSDFRVLYPLLFELSRTRQNKLIGGNAAVREEIENALRETPRMFPKTARVACQGVEGAYSTIACEKLFASPSIMYMENFESVFSAVEKGLCDYGVLPIENSTAGSVNKNYDLMISHKFHIVRATRIKINHCLVAKPGTAPEDIKEVFSHEQAINQCRGFFSSFGKGVKLTAVENTAMAAELVASSDRNDIAAISSYRCAELYNLKCLQAGIQDNGNNHTRFICISRNLEIYPGADRTSLMMVLPHKPGSLYKMLARFYALGINLVKLESRPIPERDFEFMFYFDLDTSVYSEEFIQLMSELGDSSEEYYYLGSYSEAV